jgi:uncharacterized membrane protein HdeD (DUF308 family)
MNYFEIHTKFGSKFIEAEEKGGEHTMYWLTGIAGVLLILAPFVFSYADNQAALWTSLMAGLVVIVASVWEGFERQKENWEYWTAGIVGIVAIFAPFMLGFGSHASAMWTTVIMGAVIAILGFGKIMSGGVSRT